MELMKQNGNADPSALPFLSTIVLPG